MDLAVKPSMVASVVSRAASVKRPIFIWGAPGIGKSDIVSDITYNRLPGNNLLIDCRLALMEPPDLRGYPYRNPETNVMEWSPPADLPSPEMGEQYDNIVLFLDELNSAPPSVQAAAYQLILNRRVGQYALPDNVIIIAAGNRETDRGVTYRMPAPLANRFRHVTMAVDFDDWQRWAVNNNQHSDVIGYLSYFKSDLFDFNPKSASTAWASPRSWSFVSEILNCPGFDAVDGSEQKAEIAGAVGEGMAGKFVEHRRVAKMMPKPEDIIAGTAKKLDSKMNSEISAKYAMIVALAFELKELNETESKSDFIKGFNHALRFVFGNTDPEMVILFLRTIMHEYAIRVNIRTDLDKDLMTIFREKYTKYIVE